jgi:hypothetical protein
MSEENLETKLKGESDWKLWIPIYGMIKVISYGNDRRPTFVEDAISTMGFVYVGYQSVISQATQYILHMSLQN